MVARSTSFLLTRRPAMQLISSRLASHLPAQISAWLAPREETLPAAPIDESPECSRLVSAILELNPTASPLFLNQFPIAALEDYLEHLLSAAQPRGRDAIRIRPANTPGITTRRARA